MAFWFPRRYRSQAGVEGKERHKHLALGTLLLLFLLLPGAASLTHSCRAGICLFKSLWNTASSWKPSLIFPPTPNVTRKVKEAKFPKSYVQIYYRGQSEVDFLLN